MYMCPVVEFAKSEPKAIDSSVGRCQAEITNSYREKFSHLGTIYKMIHKKNKLNNYSSGILYLTGPMRLISSDGIDSTPGGQVRKAILAILALSPDMQCSRRRLIDLLWADKPSKSANGVLRTALFQLRKELASLSEMPLGSDHQRVWIQPTSLEIRKDPDSGELLEGIDLVSEGSEGFEDWLRAARQSLRSEADRRIQVVVTPPVEQRPPALGLVGSLRDFDSDVIPVQANWLLDALSAQISDWIDCPIFDYRKTFVTTSSQDDAGPSVLICAGQFNNGGNEVVSLRVVRALDDVQLWSAQFEIPSPSHRVVDSPELGVFVARTADRLIKSLQQNSTRATAHHILRVMFESDVAKDPTSIQLLDDYWQEMPEASALCLSLYYETLRLGEDWSERRVISKCEIGPAVRKIISDDETGSILMTSAGYAAHYLGFEPEIASDLLITATERSPFQAYCWDHLALFRYHKGQIREACIASDRAMENSRGSPFRAVYETTRAMVAFSEQDYETSSRLSRSALARRPNFSAAMRYGAASLALGGQIEDASRIGRTIRAHAPDFQGESILSGAFRTPNLKTAKRLVTGLCSGGLD